MPTLRLNTWKAAGKAAGVPLVTNLSGPDGLSRMMLISCKKFQM